MAHVNSRSVWRLVQCLLACLITMITSVLNFSSADPPYELCPVTNAHAFNTAFQNNIDKLLSQLSSNASLLKFYSTSHGNDTNGVTVYGQYMCLNYVSDQDCQSCIGGASADILRLCPNSTEAIVWEETCQLRYSGQNFTGHLNVTGNIWKDNQMNASQPETFEGVVNRTLQNLTLVASSNPPANMYATGEVDFKDDGAKKLYALVQCGGDLSQSDCTVCLQRATQDVLANCSFSVGARLLSRSCYLRYELYAFYEGKTEPDQATAESNGKKMELNVMLALVFAGLAVALLVSCFFCLAMYKRYGRGNKSANQLDALRNISYTNGRQSHGLRRDRNVHDFPFINFATILNATNSFSPSNKLGQGGFGPVYKGVLGDGTEVAIKRLLSTEQGTEEFTNEVLLIMKLQHKNLVKLLGFCVENEEKILVYEYMPNCSLDIVLFNRARREKLDWSKRVNIVNGIARGVLYLHMDSRLNIIHRDLKASNVLLDSEMSPKISDFGMARIFSGNDDGANTETIVGTYGYMAPEYAMEGLYSPKSDVFSFGVLVLEIITGARNASFHVTRLAPTLTAYAWHLWQEGRELELIDPLMVDSCCAEEFRRYLHIGLLCVQEDSYDRPTMSSVVVMMKNEGTALKSPKRPAFSVGRFTDHHHDIAHSSCSINGVTISNIEAR